MRTSPKAYIHRKPAWNLTVDGQVIDDTINPRLISITLTEKRGADADELELSLSDHDGDLKIPKRGAQISLSLGWLDLGENRSPVLVDKGKFKVDEVAHAGAPDVLSIRARSADLTRAFRSRRSLSWEETTVGDVLSEIAGRNGLQLACSDDMASVEIAHLAQSRESDAAFLSRLGRIHDAVATVKAGRLVFMACDSDVSPSGQQLGAVTITRADGDKHSWKQSERGAYSGVVAEWHDRAGAERKTAVEGSEDNAKRLSRVYASEDAAVRAARKEYQRLQRGKAEFSLTLARGRPDLFPQKRVAVEGFKPEIDASDWLITEARHSISAGGFVTALQMELGAGS